MELFDSLVIWEIPMWLGVYGIVCIWENSWYCISCVVVGINIDYYWPGIMEWVDDFLLRVGWTIPTTRNEVSVLRGLNHYRSRGIMEKGICMVCTWVMIFSIVTMRDLTSYLRYEYRKRVIVHCSRNGFYKNLGKYEIPQELGRNDLWWNGLVVVYWIHLCLKLLLCLNLRSV